VARPVLLPAEDKSFTVERRPDGVWHVHGPYIEKIVAMTKWDYYAAVMRFQRILEALGITQALRVAGIAEGDTVHIGGIEFEWSD
jgi:GTP-binding protein